MRLGVDHERVSDPVEAREKLAEAPPPSEKSFAQCRARASAVQQKDKHRNACEQKGGEAEGRIRERTRGPARPGEARSAPTGQAAYIRADAAQNSNGHSTVSSALAGGRTGGRMRTRLTRRGSASRL